MSSGDGRPPSDDSTRPRSLGSDTDESLLTRFRTAQTGPLMFVREMLTSVLAVALVGLLLFALSGVWPPMVAVESGSMEPHMQKGDLIFITEPGRFVPNSAHEDTGVVTYESGEETDYRTFGTYGSVIIYDNPNSLRPPIIHRARFWVDEGENWYDEANPDYVRAENCEQLRYCPAPHAGFITKGDNNAEYDQANGISEPVRPEWVQGVAHVRIPYLGWVRLGFSGAAVASPTDDGVGTQGNETALDTAPTTAVKPVATTRLTPMIPTTAKAPTTPTETATLTTRPSATVSG